jgi:hypothetical protein
MAFILIMWGELHVTWNTFKEYHHLMPRTELSNLSQNTGELNHYFHRCGAEWLLQYSSYQKTLQHINVSKVILVQQKEGPKVQY